MKSFLHICCCLDNYTADTANYRIGLASRFCR